MKFKHWFQKRRAKVVSIRISPIYKVHAKLGYPDFGSMIQAKMISGKIAVYKCTQTEYAGSTDWRWLIFTFDHWLEEGESYPVYC